MRRNSYDLNSHKIHPDDKANGIELNRKGSSTRRQSPDDKANGIELNRKGSSTRRQSKASISG